MDATKAPIKIDQPIVGFKVLKKQDPIIITPEPEEASTPAPVSVKQAKRPTKLSGYTYKIVNGAEGYNLYMTINYLDGEPFEIFFDSSNTEAVQWIKAFSRISSAVLRSDDSRLDLRLIAEQLLKCPGKGYFVKGMGYIPGIVVHIGRVLLDILADDTAVVVPELETTSAVKPGKLKPELRQGKECPDCHKFTLIVEGGCTKCSDLEDCGYMGECG